MTLQEKLAQQVQLLESLSVVDAEIKKLDSRISEEETALDGLRKELVFLDGKIAADRTSVEEMHKTMGELGVEVRQMGTQIDRSREKLTRARNERESVAAEREMDELRKLLRDREEEVVKLGSLAESAKKTLQEIQTQRDKVHAELSSTESETSKRIADVIADREQKIAKRTEIQKQVAPATLRRYDIVRKKKGSGLAPVTDGTCRSCHIQIPPQIFQRIQRQEALEECPNCHRILYWSPAPPAEEPNGAKNT
jgi:hypothetical protein